MKCHVWREEPGSRAPGVPGCPSVLKAWVCFCSALKFTKHGLLDEPAGICGICLQFQVLRFPAAGSSELRTLFDEWLCSGSANHARFCKSELGSVLLPDVVFFCHCPTWSANACCLLRARSLSFRGSLRGCGSSAEPAAPPCLRAE